MMQLIIFAHETKFLCVMKGILPAPCRPTGYVLLVLAVFLPMLMFMFGMVTDSNVLCVKLLMKLIVWVSLFMVLLAKRKEEDEVTARLRSNAMKYGLYIWGIYYIGVLAIAAFKGDLGQTDSSIGYIYMVIVVLVFEVLVQKRKAEKMFRGKR